MVKEQMKKAKGITLISLVVTIIVLLILAGVSIVMLTGENGIITQANKAKIEQSHGAVKEAISLSYNEWQIQVNVADTRSIASTKAVKIQGKEEKANNGTLTTFLEFLKDKEYIREETENILNVEKLTGSKQALGNGENTDIYKIVLENNNYILSYIDENNKQQELWRITANGEIIINISKEEKKVLGESKTVAVKLTVDSITINGKTINNSNRVENLTQEEYAKEILEKLSKMEETEKENLIVEIYNSVSETKINNFNDFITKVYETEENFNKIMDEIGGFDILIDTAIIETNYDFIGNYNKETGELTRYEVINPDNENSDVYLATQNGDYTFKVKANGKEYNKTINISNIYDIEENNEYNIENFIDEYLNESFYIGLKNKETGEFVNFSNVYIFYNNDLIDITQYITNKDEITMIYGPDLGELLNWKYGEFNFIIVKDNKIYEGESIIDYPI